MNAEQLRLSVLELDRLSTAATGLLDMARGKTAIIGPAIDVSELMTRAAERWHAQVNAAGRTIVATTSGSIMLRASRGLVDQILDVLIENSLKHGAGAIELTAREFKTSLDSASMIKADQR